MSESGTRWQKEKTGKPTCGLSACSCDTVGDWLLSEGGRRADAASRCCGNSDVGEALSREDGAAE